MPIDKLKTGKISDTRYEPLSFMTRKSARSVVVLGIVVSIVNESVAERATYT